MTKTTYMIRERWVLASLAARRTVLTVKWRIWYELRKVTWVQWVQVVCVTLAVLIVVVMGAAIVAIS